jgi:hypothetical protein
MAAPVGHVAGTFTALAAARVVVSDPSLTSRIVSRDGCAVAAVPRPFPGHAAREGTGVAVPAALSLERDPLRAAPNLGMSACFFG